MHFVSYLTEGVVKSVPNDDLCLPFLHVSMDGRVVIVHPRDPLVCLLRHDSGWHFITLLNHGLHSEEEKST